MLLIIESGLISTAVVGHPPPVLVVAVVVMPQSAPLRLLLTLCKSAIAYSEPEVL